VFLAIPFGSILSGLLIDVYGRRASYGLGLLMVIISTIGMSIVPSIEEGMSSIFFVAAWRIALGIGIGYGYPQTFLLMSP
jgi:MFS family permease